MVDEGARITKQVKISLHQARMIRDCRERIIAYAKLGANADYRISDQTVVNVALVILEHLINQLPDNYKPNPCESIDHIAAYILQHGLVHRTIRIKSKE